VGAKEARFWKPGKNPVPDYAHLLMSAAEMRAYLESGPCCAELIDPILQWIYEKGSINRCHFEEYIEVFERCSLALEDIDLHGDAGPDANTLTELHERYGPDRNFRCSGISALFRRMPEEDVADATQFMRAFRWSRWLRKRIDGNVMMRRALDLAEILPGTRHVLRQLRRWKRRAMGLK